MGANREIMMSHSVFIRSGYLRDHLRKLAGLLLLAAALPVFAAVKPAEQFSADQVMTVNGHEMLGRVFVDGGNLRTEMNAPGAPPMVSIVNASKKALWILMPGNMYMEKTLEQDDDLSRQAWTQSDRLEPMGRETVNGVECEKFRIRGDRQELLYYFSAKDGLPVRMVSRDGKVQIDWKNAKKGPQSAALFELPPGLTKFALPSLPGGFKLPGMK